MEDASEEGSAFEKIMKKDEIERLLKYGAYFVFQEEGNEKMDEDFDFDKIISSAPTVVYNSTERADAKLSMFSKAMFVASEADMEVDMHDTNFWEKVLPSFKQTERLNELLQVEGALDTEEKRAQFIEDVRLLISDLKSREQSNEENSIDDLKRFLRRARKSGLFNSEQRKQMRKWIKENETPRLRKRERKSWADEDLYSFDFEDPPRRKRKRKEKEEEVKESRGGIRTRKMLKNSVGDEENLTESSEKDANGEVEVVTSPLPVASPSLNSKNVPTRFSPLPSSLTFGSPADLPVHPKRKLKNKIDSGRPKRWLSSFMFFANERRGELFAKNKRMTVSQCATILAKQWKVLPAEDKKVRISFDVVSFRNTKRCPRRIKRDIVRR